MRLVYKNTADSAAIHTSTAEGHFDKVTVSELAGLRAGQVVKFSANGKFSTTGTPGLRLKAKIGTVVLADSGVITTANDAANLPWSIEGEFTVRTGGSSGVVDGHATILIGKTASTSEVIMHRTGALSANLVTQIVGRASAQWDASSASNTTLLENLRFWVSPA